MRRSTLINSKTMEINVTGLIDEVKILLKDELSSDVPLIVELNEAYLERTKDRVGNLASGAASGELTFKEVSTELLNEGENLKVHLMSQAQIAEAKAEAAAGKIISKLLDFVFKTAISFL